MADIFLLNTNFVNIPNVLQINGILKEIRTGITIGILFSSVELELAVYVNNYESDIKAAAVNIHKI